MDHANELSRRGFLHSTATSTAAGAATLLAVPAVAPAIAAGAVESAANQRLRIGFIGPGRRGFGSHVKTLATLRKQGRKIDLTAVCDVYRVHRDRAVDYIQRETGTSPRAFVDYRDMIAGNIVDAVCIATPESFTSTRPRAKCGTAMPAGRVIGSSFPSSMPSHRSCRGGALATGAVHCSHRRTSALPGRGPMASHRPKSNDPAIHLTPTHRSIP